MTDRLILFDRSDYRIRNHFTLAMAVRHVRYLKKSLPFVDWPVLLAWTIGPTLGGLALYGAWCLLEAT